MLDPERHPTDVAPDLLGWAIAEDRDIFSMEEMVEAFEIDRVNPNPARFDLKKAEAINSTHLRALSTVDLADPERAVPGGDERPGHDRREDHRQGRAGHGVPTGCGSGAGAGGVRTTTVPRTRPTA